MAAVTVTNAFTDRESSACGQHFDPVQLTPKGKKPQFSNEWDPMCIATYCLVFDENTSIFNDRNTNTFLSPMPRKLHRFTFVSCFSIKKTW